MDSLTADIIAIITGVAAICTAVGGMFMAFRAVRNRERKAAKDDLHSVNEMLADERKQRLTAERRNYDLAMLLATHGIDVPEEKPDDESGQVDN